MTKELNRQMWTRFCLGTITFIAAIWGASAKFQITEERSLRNERGHNELKLTVDDEAKKSLAWANHSREQYHELKAENSSAEIRQQALMSDIDDIKASISKNHMEIMDFVLKLERAD